MGDDGLRLGAELMRARGVDERAIMAFTRFYAMLEHDATGHILEDTIEPLGAVQALEDLEISDTEARAALATSVVLKLNGGLGTSMGISGPKSALPVRDGLTFLDIIARQVLAIRKKYDVELPVVFMDSFRTQGETLEILAAYDDLAVEDVPLSFVQSAEPKLRADDLTPVSWPDDPELAWCPPGHGDVYIALQSSGLLDTLRDKGFRHLFLSNADNLGAVCDPRIPAWMADEDIPYVAEVCERTRNDRKGGHLARRREDGRLILRDSAQVAPGEEGFFADNERHEYFHVNNLWIDLDVLATQLAERAGVLELPIIVNRKTVDPTLKESTPVIQIESSMGTAVEVFEGSQALFVPRDRFRPVKTTNELLLVRSDIYELDAESRVVSLIDHEEPFIDLSSEFKFVFDFDDHFPHGVPSISEARSLVVEGDVTFGRDIACVGDVTVRATEPRTIADGARLEGDV